MKVWATWYGGAGYSPPTLPDDLEVFDSLRDARDAFWDRGSGRWPHHFEYVHKDAEDTYTPGVDESSELWVYFYDPTDSDDPYPDRRIWLGPYGRRPYQ